MSLRSLRLVVASIATIVAVLAALFVALRAESDVSSTPTREPSSERESTTAEVVHVEPVIDAAPVTREPTATDSEIEIEASEPDARPDLVVRVVDASGRPIANVPVGLESRASATDAFEADYDDRTGAAGEASFSAQILDEVCVDTESELRVGVMWPLAKACQRTLPRREAEGNRIDLVLEFGCRVEVEVTEGGLPVAESVDVRLEIRRERDPEFLAFDSSTTTDGRAVFNYVPEGSQLFAAAQYCGITSETDVAAPPVARADETAKFRVELAAVTRLSLRLLSASGAPLQSKSVALERLDSIDAETISRNIRTDGDGRATIVWPLPEVEAHPRMRFRVRSVDDASSVTLDVGPYLRIGRSELGDVRLVEAPLLAAGRVVDSQGRPLGNARVVLGDEHPEESPEFIPFFTPDRECEPAETRPDGTFVIRGERETERLVIAAFAKDRSPESIEIARGARNLELRLEGRGSIEGSIALPPGWDAHTAEAIRVHARELDPDPRFGQRFTSGYRLERNGSFTITGLRSGRYRISFTIRGCGTRHQFDDVVVKCDANTRDPRLQGVAIRDGLRTIEVKIVDAAGTSIENATVGYDGSDGAVGLASSDASGDAVLVAPLHSVVLGIAKDGFRAAIITVAATATPIRVVLQPALSVTLRVGLSTLEPSIRDVTLTGRRIVVSLMPTGSLSAAVPGVVGASISHSADSIRINGRGDARLSIGLPGAYHVEWRVADSKGIVDGDPIVTSEIVISDTADEQTIWIEAPEAVLSALNDR